MKPLRYLALVVLFATSCWSGKPPITNTPPPQKPSAKPYAIAFVFNSWELWVGNDELLPDTDPTRYRGVLQHLKAAVDEMAFARDAPAGSQGAIISYADKAAVRVPMGPLDKLVGSSFGTQKDYYGMVGVELVQAVRLGLVELAKANTPRKVLVVLGDGNDTNNETATAHLAQLAVRAAQQNIQIYAIVYKAHFSEPNNVVTALTENVVTVNTVDALGTALAELKARWR